MKKINLWVIVFLFVMMTTSHAGGGGGGSEGGEGINGTGFLGTYTMNKSKLLNAKDLPYKFELIGNDIKKPDGKWIIKIRFFIGNNNYVFRANYEDNGNEAVYGSYRSDNYRKVEYRFDFQMRDTPVDTYSIKARFSLFDKNKEITTFSRFYTYKQKKMIYK